MAAPEQERARMAYKLAHPAEAIYWNARQVLLVMRQ